MPGHQRVHRSRVLIARLLWRPLRCFHDKLWLAGPHILTTLNRTGWTLTQGQQILPWSRGSATQVALGCRSWKHGHWGIVSGARKQLCLLSAWHEAAVWFLPHTVSPAQATQLRAALYDFSWTETPTDAPAHRRLKTKWTPVPQAGEDGDPQAHISSAWTSQCQYLVKTGFSFPRWLSFIFFYIF